MVDLVKLFEELNNKLQDTVELAETGQGIYTKRDNIVSLMKMLKEECGFRILADITAVDYINYYEVIYHLLNMNADLLSVKVKLEKSDSEIQSIISVWKAADPQEREVFDLMGIVFKDHPNLKRILCPDDFEGHPLQKNYKLDVVNRF